MNYLKPTFAVAMGGSKYAEGWDRIFGKKEDSMNLSPHFTLPELTVTSFRVYDNTPNDRQLDNLSKLANEQLEGIREVWGCPTVVTSGFRCRDIETAIHGGVYPPRGSQHGDGCAADIYPVSIPIRQAFEAVLDSTVQYDQIILEIPTAAGGWVHVSRPLPGNPYRRQALVFTGGTSYYPWEEWKNGHPES
jgi:zinc D-Ala-D-Ala carboxypeptidase